MEKDQERKLLCAIMLNRIFDRTLVRTMIQSVSSSGIYTKHKQCHIKRYVCGKVNISIQTLVFIDIDEAIEMLEEKTKKKDRFYLSRRKWLVLLRFAKKNYNKLSLDVVESVDMSLLKHIEKNKTLKEILSFKNNDNQERAS